MKIVLSAVHLNEEEKMARNPARKEDPENYYRNCLRIGKMLQGYRENNGLSQLQIAKKLGFAANHVSNLENGHTRISLGRIFEMCEAYGLKEDTPGFVILILKEVFPHILELAEKVCEIKDENNMTTDEIANEAIKRYRKKCRRKIEE